MTPHPFAFPADGAGHVLVFTHPPERDYMRTAACTACRWQMPAPGTGYQRARVEHSKAHAHLLTEVGPDQGTEPCFVDNDTSTAQRRA